MASSHESIDFPGIFTALPDVDKGNNFYNFMQQRLFFPLAICYAVTLLCLLAVDLYSA